MQGTSHRQLNGVISGPIQVCSFCFWPGKQLDWPGVSWEESKEKGLTTVLSLVSLTLGYVLCFLVVGFYVRDHARVPSALNLAQHVESGLTMCLPTK